VVAVLYAAVPLLLWRLLDLLDEVLYGPIKMSLATLVITGAAATLIQLAIIGLLSFVVYSAADAVRSPIKETSLH
jgi:hypothetical protein